MSICNNLSVILCGFIFGICWVQLYATKQVILTCGSDKSSERGLPGYPGKRGPTGSTGSPGQKGSKGNKGEIGICPRSCQVSFETIAMLERDAEGFKACLQRCINGRCLNKNDSYLCKCFAGYAGKNCTAVVCNNPRCPAHSDCTGPNQCTCNEGYFQNIHTCSEIRDCKDIALAGFTSSGVYNITVPGRTNSVQVYCDLNTDGGGWLVFQRRMDGSVDFYRNWVEYQHGFGDRNGEFWLGLDTLHSITTSMRYTLRVDLEDWEGNTAFAVYSFFAIENSQTNYRLHVNGYQGIAGDSLNYHNNQQFSTKDRDNDKWSSGHCTQNHHGAWWYNKCHYTNLNGEYLRNGQINERGVTWRSWKNSHYSMKRSEMKIKPT